MDALRRHLKRQIIAAIEERQPDPAAIFVAQLQRTMIELTTYAEASHATAHPVAIQAQSFDMIIDQK